jgi:hypothetical protein
VHTGTHGRASFLATTPALQPSSFAIVDPWRKASGRFPDERVHLASEDGAREVMLDEVPDEFAGQRGHQRMIAGPNLDIVLIT